MSVNPNPPNRFVYHQPDETMIEWMQKVRQQCFNLDKLLCDMPSHPRYTALARTELEKVSMWANKGITFVHEQ